MNIWQDCTEFVRVLKKDFECFMNYVTETGEPVKGTGTCFVDTLELIKTLPDDALIVQGLCVNNEGELYAHAWCEHDGVYTIVMYQNKPHILHMPTERFNHYARPTNKVTKYTKEQLRKLLKPGKRVCLVLNDEYLPYTNKAITEHVTDMV